MLARPFLFRRVPPPPPTEYVGLINGCPTDAYEYDIGAISTTDAGETWTVEASPCITNGSGWKSIYVKDPSVVWDGTQFVAYYCGWNGSNFQLGRATASAMTGPWTDYGSNPVIGVPNDGSYRQSGALFPFLFYDPNESPAWKMWIAGSNAGVFTIGFLDSADGITWTDHGQVIAPGSAGQFDDTWTVTPSAIKVGATWYVYYTGYRSATGFMHAGYATCTDPADDATYTKQGQLANFTGNLALDGFTFRSNAIRQIIRHGSQYIVLGDAWNPSGDTEEGCWRVLSPSLTAIPAPTELMIPLGSGWDANSSENPSVVAA